MRSLKLYTENTVLDFGKYSGIELKDILNSNSEYLKWCVDNVDWFVVEEDLIEVVLSNHSIINFINDEFSAIKDCLSDNVKSISRAINLNKYNLLINSSELENDYCDDVFDYNDDWANDMSSNYLSYAAGTDDPETMNDVYWNLD